MIVRKVACPLFLVVEPVLYSALALIQTKIIEKPNKRFLTLSPCRIANITPDPRHDNYFEMAFTGKSLLS